MCFSAGASFTASTILLGIGVASLYKAQSAPQKVLACIPLFFAIQQFIEGVLWLSLMHTINPQWQQPAMYAFLVFALVIWPMFVPFSMLLLEKEAMRKKILLPLSGAGVLLSIYLLYCLISYPANVTASHHHILYDFDFPYAHKWYSGLIYFIPTVIAPFVSSIKRIRLIAVAIVLSYLASRIFYGEYVISIWCYFAAIISIIVLTVIISLNKSPDTRAFVTVK